MGADLWIHVYIYSFEMYNLHTKQYKLVDANRIICFYSAHECHCLNWNWIFSLELKELVATDYQSHAMWLLWFISKIYQNMYKNYQNHNIE